MASMPLFAAFLELPKSELTHVVLFLLRRRRFERELALSICDLVESQAPLVERRARGRPLVSFSEMLWDTDLRSD